MEGQGARDIQARHSPQPPELLLKSQGRRSGKGEVSKMGRWTMTATAEDANDGDSKIWSECGFPAASCCGLLHPMY